MRVASVVSAIAVGLALGSAVVLAPLVTRDATPSAMSEGHARPTTAAAPWSTIAAVTLNRDRPGTAPGTGEKALEREKTSDRGREPKVDVQAKATDTPWAAQVTMATASAPGRRTASRATSDEQRAQLVRELQSELKRVGCYIGAIDGEWDHASKAAMGAFNDRVNATLPFDEPDFILLTLVQGHRGHACGQSCPSGQMLDSAGRCLPTAVVAGATGRARQQMAAARATAPASTVQITRSESAPATRSTSAAAQPPVAAPPRPVLAVRPAGKLVVGRETDVATDSRATNPHAPVDRKLTAAVSPPEPLPGRMAIGGPVASSHDVTPQSSQPLAASRVAAAPTGTVMDAPIALSQADGGNVAVTTPAAPPVQHKTGNWKTNRPGEAKTKYIAQRPPPAAVPQRPSKSVRQRQMVYDMFQNPSRQN